MAFMSIRPGSNRPHSLTQTTYGNYVIAQWQIAMAFGYGCDTPKAFAKVYNVSLYTLLTICLQQKCTFGLSLI